LTQAAAPKDIVRRMSAETTKALNSPDIKAKFEALGIITGDTSPEFAAKFLDDEVVKWSKVISAAGVKAE
jgi:tripartite-type tricarboxylate transporter receptor subunit TctC